MCGYGFGFPVAGRGVWGPLAATGPTSAAAGTTVEGRARHVPGASTQAVRRAASGMGRRRAPELYRAPFPLYALQVEPSAGLLIAAGGGGAAKTGIKNGVVRVQGPWGRVARRGLRAILGGSRGRAALLLRTLPLSRVGMLGLPGVPARVSVENSLTGQLKDSSGKVKAAHSAA